MCITKNVLYNFSEQLKISVGFVLGNYHITYVYEGLSDIFQLLITAILVGNPY